MIARYLIASALLVMPANAAPKAGAGETFLAALDGSWSGRGEVRIRTDRSPLRISCDVEVTTPQDAFDLSGECGALFVKREIGVALERDGDGFSGVYTGAGSGPAKLMGSLDGDAVELEITWNAKINGDDEAAMSLSLTEDGTLRLVTRDRDPETDAIVVTSDIALKRAD